MKRYLLIIIFVLFFCVDFHGYQDPNPKSLTQINMRGRLIQPKTRSPRQNFTVLQNCKYIQVNFLRTLGALDVVIFTDDSVVYQNRINAAGGSIIAVETSSWKNGTYIMTICDLQKQCANGEFTIKKE